MRNQRTIDAFTALLREAETGYVEEFFVVFRCSDDTHNSVWSTPDLGDMLLQVRTEIIKAQTERDRKETMQ